MYMYFICTYVFPIILNYLDVSDVKRLGHVEIISVSCCGLRESSLCLHLHYLLLEFVFMGTH